MDKVSILLATIACLDDTKAGLARIIQAAVPVSDWDAVLKEAEKQRMSPLLYRAIKLTGLEVDLEKMRQLKALTLRHRLVNQVRGKVLEEILSAARSENLSPLVVKGAALCWLIYDEPALRPMVDIDLLTSEDQQLPMQQVLLTMGFTEAHPDEIFSGHRHLPPLSKEVDGFHLSVEVHHSLYTPTHGQGHWGTVSELLGKPVEFTISPGGILAHTLGPEDTLLQLCMHMNEMGGEFGSFRMLWVADIHAFLSRYENKVDWVTLKVTAQADWQK